MTANRVATILAVTVTVGAALTVYVSGLVARVVIMLPVLR